MIGNSGVGGVPGGGGLHGSGGVPGMLQQYNQLCSVYDVPSV